MNLMVTWLDAGRKAQCPPDPMYPNGLGLDLSAGADDTCRTKLRYPAPGVGAWLVNCTICGLTAYITAAGRADDPKLLTVACKRRGRDRPRDEPQAEYTPT